MTDQNSQFFAILTDIGRAKQANADALGMPWTFAQMAVGDANGTDPIPSSSQTKLINERRRAPLNQVKVDPSNASVIIAEQVIHESVGGWWVRELALYDKDGDMVAVANCAPTYKSLLAQGSGRTQIIRINLIVSNTANIELKIDPSVVLATREYVDTSVIEALAKLDFKNSVLVATTSNIALNGIQTVDGVLLTENARVLVKDQAQAKDNGIYVVPASGAWNRAQDADASTEVTPGLFVTVEKGTANGDSVWQLVTDAPIVLGTTPLAFEVVTGRTGIVAGTYRSLTVDKNGRVIAGTNPTTLAAYGITDGATKTELSDAVNALLPKVGGTLSGSVILNNGGEDTPEFGWKSPTCEAFIDLLNAQVRISANYGGTFSTPLLLNITNKSASVFGFGLWHGGNFDPLKYAVAANTYTRSETDQQINYRALRDSISTVGLASNDPNLPYMLRSSDGIAYYLQPRLGFTPVQQGGGTDQLSNRIMIGWSAQGLKAQVDTLDLGIIWSGYNFNPNDKADKASTTAALAQCIKLSQDVPAGSNPRFSSSGSGPISYLSTSTGALEIHNGGVAAASAVAMFNRQGLFSAYLGLDTDNQFKVGGWSMGNVAHTLWHAGNAPKNTASLGQNGWKKDADTGEIIQWVEVVIGEISASRIQSIVWPTTFPGAFLNARISFRQGSTSGPSNVNGAYSGATTSGCQVRIDEWGGTDQGTSLTLIVEARGY